MRARGCLINAAIVAGTLALCFGALEIGLRLFGSEHGDWYGAGPQRAAFRRNHVDLNSAGFRDAEFPATRTPGRTRILAVGDSFTFGAGIEDPADTWPKVLEARLRESGWDVEVLNFGRAGTNTAFQRHLLNEQGWTLSPDRIVLAFVPNDPEPPGSNTAVVPVRLNPPLLPLPGLDLALSRTSWSYAWIRARKNRVLERLGSKETYDEYVRSLYEPGPDWNAFQEAASGLVTDATRRGVPVTVALFPLIHDLESNPWDAQLARAAEVFRKAGAEVVDLREAFRGHATAELRLSPTDAHPNELGQRLAAEAVARQLAPELER